MADDTMMEGAPEAATIEDDAPVDDSLTVLQASREYYREAEMAGRTRLLKNRKNRRAYLAEGDWSHKRKGQSREFIPKTPMAIEQFSAFVKRAIVGSGDWFQAEGPMGDPLAPHVIRKILLCYLESCGPQEEPFATIASDGTKVGALESLMIFKVHGRMKTESQYRVKQNLEPAVTPDGRLAPRVTEELAQREVTSWKLLIELVRPEDYYPDPSGRGLYEIHEVERDLSDVIAWADDGVYDREAVDQITEDFQRPDDKERREEEKGQDETTPPAFRKRVVIREYYGTVLDSKGHVVHRKAFWAVANDQYLIRKPQPLTDLFWHGQSPLVAIPIIRVPFSTLHKALADNMTPLNTALNELFNLMFDGGLAAVWGTRQIRTDWLEDPRQVADGVPQGMTLQVNSNCPPGEKVMEQVTTGQVPQDAMAMYAATEREFLSASLSNELNLGQLPSKQVKATEIVEASSSRAVTIDGLVKDIEKGIEKVIRLAWLTLLQHADDLATDDVTSAIGPRSALILARMSPAERFTRYATTCRFRVFGLSAVLARQQDFQKMVAAMGLIGTNPFLLQAFVKKYSFEKALDSLFKALNISPDMLMADEMEMMQRPDMMAQIPMLQQMLGIKKPGEGNGVPGVAPQGGEAVGAQANQQMTNPLAELGL